MPIAVKLIEKLLKLTKWAFQNAKEFLEVKEKISERGYDDTRLDELLDLNSRLDAKYKDQQKKRADLVIAGRNFDEKFNTVRKNCKNLRLLVGKVLSAVEYEKLSRLLGLDESLKRMYEAFDEQAKKLYTNVLDDADLMARLARFGVTPEQVQEWLDELPALEELKRKRETAKGLSQTARRDRDLLYKQLSKEWSDFKDICHMVYEDEENPQYKELVGILEFSEGYLRSKAVDTEPQEEPLEEPQEAQAVQVAGG